MAVVVVALLPGCATSRQHTAASLTTVGEASPVSHASTGMTSATKKTDAETLRLVAYSAAKPLASADSRELSFEEAIATSLDRNPALVTLRANEPVAHTAFHVAETYPFNPTVQVQVLPYAREKDGNLLGVNHYVWLNQTLELAHQTAHREAGASAAWNQVRWNIVQAELANTAQTQRLYFAALYQQELHQLARQTASLHQEFAGIVERRFQAGLATAADQTTAKIAARQSRRQSELAEANYQTALLVLQRQLNLSSDEPFTLVGRLDDFVWHAVPGTDSPGRVTELAFHRPDVLAAHAGVDIARANADLAHANEIPNVGIGPYYQRDSVGTYFLGLRAQLNLPVWDSGRPLTNQRRAEQSLQITTFNQLRLRANTEARTALERYERARRLAAREGADSAETTAAELRSLRRQFEAGEVGVLNVYAAQAALLQDYRTYLDLLNEVAQAAADVTLMLGMSPALVIGNPPGDSSPEELPGQ